MYYWRIKLDHRGKTILLVAIIRVRQNLNHEFVVDMVSYRELAPAMRSCYLVKRERGKQ